MVSTTICRGRYELFIIGNERPGTVILATLDRSNISEGFKVILNTKASGQYLYTKSGQNFSPLK